MWTAGLPGCTSPSSQALCLGPGQPLPGPTQANKILWLFTIFHPSSQDQQVPSRSPPTPTVLPTCPHCFRCFRCKGPSLCFIQPQPCDHIEKWDQDPPVPIFPTPWDSTTSRRDWAVPGPPENFALPSLLPMGPLPGTERKIPRSGSASCPCPCKRCPFCSSGPSARQAWGSGLTETALQERGPSVSGERHTGLWKSPGLWDQAARAWVLTAEVPTPACTFALGPPQAPRLPPFTRAPTGRGLPGSSPWHCLSVAQPARPFLLEITGLLCQVPAPASPSLITSRACPLYPVWALGGAAGTGHPSEEGCSQRPQGLARAGPPWLRTPTCFSHQGWRLRSPSSGHVGTRVCTLGTWARVLGQT